MFTGIVTEIAEVVAVQDFVDRRRLRLALGVPRNPIIIGASIAVSGVCLTVVALDIANRALVDFDVGAETLAVTNADAWKAGDMLNVERALKVGDELGGHIVSGHVDALASIVSISPFNDMTHMRLKAPHALAQFIAKKGSVTLDGVSLTVNAVDGDAFEILMIPHTLKVTTLGLRNAGDALNLEVDTMARYAERLINFRAQAPENEGHS